VNDSFVGSLDLSRKMDSGDVGVGTVLDQDARYDGMPIHFTDFTVQDFSTHASMSHQTGSM
jgi:hypothetical protein